MKCSVSARLEVESFRMLFSQQALCARAFRLQRKNRELWALSRDARMVFGVRANALASLLYRARRRRTTQLLQYGAYTLPSVRTYRRNDAGRVVDDAGVRFRLNPRALAWKPTPARGHDGRRVAAVASMRQATGPKAR